MNHGALMTHVLHWLTKQSQQVMCTIDNWRRRRMLTQKFVGYQLPAEHFRNDVRLMRGKSHIFRLVLGCQVWKRSLGRRSPAGGCDGVDGSKQRRRRSAFSLQRLSGTTSTARPLSIINLPWRTNVRVSSTCHDGPMLGYHQPDMMDQC